MHPHHPLEYDMTARRLELMDLLIRRLPEIRFRYVHVTTRPGKVSRIAVRDALKDRNRGISPPRRSPRTELSGRNSHAAPDADLRWQHRKEMIERQKDEEVRCAPQKIIDVSRRKGTGDEPPLPGNLTDEGAPRRLFHLSKSDFFWWGTVSRQGSRRPGISFLAARSAQCLR